MTIEKTAIFSIAGRYLKVSEVATREVFFTYSLLLILAVGNVIGEWDHIFPKLFLLAILGNIWMYVRAIRNAKAYVIKTEQAE